VSYVASKASLSLAVGSAIFGVVVSGCGGGSSSPSVASLGPTGPTTTTSSAAAGGPSPSKPSATAFVAFVHCLQQHGVPAQLGSQGRGVSISGGDPNSPQFQAAQKACQKLLPGGGPQLLSPAQRAQELRELLALAGCMRKHGYPSFPDPNSQGGFDFSSGGTIDPQSPQFQSAMSTCRPRNGKVPLRIGIRLGAPPGNSLVKP
jgi:hypothetical protein